MEKIVFSNSGQWSLQKNDDKPMTLYHGTSAKEPFSDMKMGTSDHGEGIYAATDKGLADEYAQHGLTAELHANLKNPINSDLFDSKARGKFMDRWKQHLDKNPNPHLEEMYHEAKEEGHSDITTHILQEREPEAQSAFLGMLRHMGHDAIANPDLNDESKVSHYQILDPSKVKIHKWHRS